MGLDTELVKAFNDGYHAAGTEIERLKTDLHDCKNELCLYCGRYKQIHKGACEGCRWRDV